MSDAMIKVAIIGCGAIASVHYDVAHAHEAFCVIGVYDASVERAEAFAKERNLAVYPTLEALLASEASLVAICTPSGLHAPLAIQCMRAGKHVVVEKPIALTEEDCDALLAVERETGCICAPISQLRYYDDIRRAKEILESGVLGKPVLCDLYMKYYREKAYYQNSWRGTVAMDGGGALMNQGIHGIDALRYLMGDVASVNAKVRTLVHDIEVEDTAVATVEFANGAVGVIEGTTSVRPGFPRRFEIHCENGSMIIEENRIIHLDLPSFSLKEQEHSYNSSSNPMNISHEGHHRQYVNLLEAIEGKAPLYYTAEEAAKSVKTVLAIYRSSRERVDVNL